MPCDYGFLPVKLSYKHEEVSLQNANCCEFELNQKMIRKMSEWKNPLEDHFNFGDFFLAYDFSFSLIRSMRPIDGVTFLVFLLSDVSVPLYWIELE